MKTDLAERPYRPLVFISMFYTTGIAQWKKLYANNNAICGESNMTTIVANYLRQGEKEKGKGEGGKGRRGPT